MFISLFHVLCFNHLFQSALCTESAKASPFNTSDVTSRILEYLPPKQQLPARLTSTTFNHASDQLLEISIPPKIKQLQQLLDAMDRDNAITKSHQIIQIMTDNPFLPLHLAKNLPMYFNNILIPLVGLQTMMDPSDYKHLSKSFSLKQCPVAMNGTGAAAASLKGLLRRVRAYQYVVSLDVDQQTAFAMHPYALKLIDDASETKDLDGITMDHIKDFMKLCDVNGKESQRRLIKGNGALMDSYRNYAVFKNVDIKIRDTLRNKMNFYSKEEMKSAGKIAWDIYVNRQFYPGFTPDEIVRYRKYVKEDECIARINIAAIFAGIVGAFSFQSGAVYVLWWLIGLVLYVRIIRHSRTIN